MRKPQISLLLAAVLVAACGDPASRASHAGTPALSAAPSAEPDAPAPVAPTLPPDPGYRDRLGEYAEYVLGSAMVPPGSPEHLQYLAECMGSAGFNVNIEAGGISANPPAEQQSFYRDALAQCEHAAIDAGLVAEAHPPDEAELAAWYAAFLLTYECLLENGYPSPQPPSVETYVESRGQNWHPYELIRPSVVGAAESACPQDLVILFEMLASSSAP